MTVQLPTNDDDPFEGGSGVPFPVDSATRPCCGGIGGHPHDCGTGAIDVIRCAPWCTDGDQHPKELLRGDQNCQGPQRKVILGLEDGAPAMPLKDDDLFSVPGITVYAFREWYSLPTVKLNLYRPTENGHLSVDVDVKLTLTEAQQLGAHLLAVVDQINGGVR